MRLCDTYTSGTSLEGDIRCERRQSVTRPPEPSISVIVPFHNASAHLERCLQALAGSRHENYELILVDDGSNDSSPEIARQFTGRIITLSSCQGPAVARNRAAEQARGTILFFIDADVFCFPDTLERIEQIFREEPDLAAVIGSYDDDPPERNFLSRYKNLTHHFVHQVSSPEGSTFWTGCGAIQRSVFQELKGFDESYRRPSIEDIELGYRLRAKGRRIRLCKRLVVKHAKRWSFSSLLRSDLMDRAVPWTILQLSHGQILDDLNVSKRQRAAAFCVCLSLLFLLAAPWEPWTLLAALPCLDPVIFWNRDLYHFYWRRGGPWFALRSVSMHVLYYLYSVLGFVLGYLKFKIAGQRSFGASSTPNSPPPTKAP